MLEILDRFPGGRDLVDDLARAGEQAPASGALEILVPVGRVVTKQIHDLLVFPDGSL